METAPPPQPQPRRFRLRSHGYLGLTALVAATLGLGVGSALRFQVMPSVTETRLSPDQSFPPLADWPPAAPRARRLDRESQGFSQRRLLPAAEAATVAPTGTAASDAGGDPAQAPAAPAATPNAALTDGDDFSNGPNDAPRPEAASAMPEPVPDAVPGELEHPESVPVTPIIDQPSVATDAPVALPLERQPTPLSEQPVTPNVDVIPSNPPLQLPEKSSPRTPLPAAPAPALE
ncbi:MAG: hypothetical protein AAFZ80_06150 [Cyanobacteria bacterium P01_A01_bin.105]